MNEIVVSDYQKQVQKELLAAGWKVAQWAPDGSPLFWYDGLNRQQWWAWLGAYREMQSRAQQVELPCPETV